MGEYQDKRPAPPGFGRDERNLSVMAHLLPLLGFILPGMNIVIPLAIWWIKRDQSTYIEHHAREALNFQITVALLVASTLR